MKIVSFCLLFVVSATLSFAGQSIGITSISVNDDDQSRPLALSLWYPGKDGIQENVGGNAVFTGVTANRDALLTVDTLPVILLSHGGLRSAGDSGAWLSAALAQVGYLVVEINAARPDTAAKAVDEIWHRPDDVSRALDAILTDPVWLKHIDETRVSVVGFALGGTAAIALAGAAFESEPYINSCSETDGGPDCEWYRAQNIDLELVEHENLMESRRDSRISSVVAIAPEYVDAFSNGLAMIDVPTLLVSLESDSGLSVFADDVIEQTTIPAASIFDGFQACTAAGPVILADEGGDPLLCGTSAKARQRAHDLIVSKVVTFLDDESLK